MSKNKNDISKNMVNNIIDYSTQIEEKDIIEGIRQVPGMYIGKIGNFGFLNMIREIFQNCVDERMKKDSPCTDIWVTYDERTLKTKISDNGRGVPFDKIISIYTKMHTSSNFTKKKGEYSSGLHGAGAKASNALSTRFTVESYILGEGRRVEFIEGYPSEKGIMKIPNNDNRQGTSVEFIPSIEMLGNLSVTVNEVVTLIRMILQLTEIGSIVHFTGYFMDGKVHSEDIINTDGILTGLIMKTDSPLVAPITCFMDNGEMKAEIIFTYDSDNLQAEDITAFSNFCPTPSGTHISGFIEGICKFFRDYMNKIYLTSSNNKKKNKLAIVNSDIKTGLKAVVNVSHLHPIFTGQAKDELSNEDMEIFVKDLIISSLDEWSKNNPKDLEKVCRYLKDIAEIRVKSEEGKIKLSNNYKTSSLSGGLPKKYIKPNGTKDLELFIVEGDSAAGSAKTGRCDDTQGVYPIRGKLPNAFVKKLTEILGNEEVAGITAILGGGHGKNFDINKVPWKKIIFGVDPDVDGGHIATLLLKIFLVLYPQLIEEGRVYKALPPLFGIEKNKKMIYYTDRYDYILYTEKLFCKENTVYNAKNKSQYTNKELANILLLNVDYTYNLECLSRNYSLNPGLVELVLMNIDKDINSLKKIINDKYRFIKDVYTSKHNTIIEGIIDGKVQTFIINEKFIKDAKHVLNLINKNESLYYIINDKLCSIYELMLKYESYTPKGLTRYKGLGEMDSDQLGESTMDINNRTLIRYTIESAKDEIETIRNMESNKYDLIKDIEITRSDLL